MGLVHQHRQTRSAAMEEVHQCPQFAAKPLVGGVHQHRCRRLQGGRRRQNPLQVRRAGGAPEAGARLEGQVEEQGLQLAQHTGMEQGAVQVAGQQHPRSGRCDGQ